MPTMPAFLILLLFAAALPAAETDHDALRDTQRKLGMEALPEGAAPQDALLGLAEAGNRAAAGQVPAGWKAQDYDALYALLEKYRDELKALGLKNLDAQLAGLKAKSEELEGRLSKTLQPLDGLKVHGRMLTELDTLQFTGPGRNSGAATRYFLPVQRTELGFEFTRGPVSGLAQMDLLWLIRNDTVLATPRRLLVEVRLPLAFEAGDLQASHSPLTLWRNEDEDPEEASGFAAVRRRLKETHYLQGNDWPLRGIRASTDLWIAGKLRLKLEAMGTQLGAARSNPRSEPVYQPWTGLPWKTVYNTYLATYGAEAPLGDFALNYRGVMMRDAGDSAAVTYLDHPHAVLPSSERILGFHSQVDSAGASFKTGAFSSSFEGAMSAYSNPNNPKLFLDPEVGSGYLSGRALRADAALKLSWLELAADFREASDSFVAPAAQGRTWDASGPGFGPLWMDNAAYDPSTDSYSTLPLPLPGQPYFNHRLLPPQVIRTQNAISNVGFFDFDTLLPYDPAINAGSPYGKATPNRRGFGGRLGLNFFEGLLQPSLRADLSQQLRSIYSGQDPERYTLLAAGLRSDWSKKLGWPLRASAGYRLEDTRNGGYVAFTSALVQAGLDWDFGPRLSLGASWRHLDFNGTLLPYLNTAYNLMPSRSGPQDQSFEQAMATLSYRFSRSVRFDALYTTLVADDLYARKLGGKPNYAADQAYARFEIAF